MKSQDTLVLLLALGVVGFVVWNNTLRDYVIQVDTSPVTPDWTAIATWPGSDAGNVEAQPDPNRRMTVIVLDDSGSMSGDIRAAKQAVVEALEPMADDDRVAVVALNTGVVLPFTSVAEAKGTLAQVLRPIRSDGSTPLTRAIQTAQTLLAEEASRVRSFGTFRVIVTTDGVADDSQALDAEIKQLAATTPIQLSTIGIGISGSHVLRRSDLGTFVDVANVSALKDALQAAVAENTDFAAITDFSAPGN